MDRKGNPPERPAVWHRLLALTAAAMLAPLLMLHHSTMAAPHGVALTGGSMLLSVLVIHQLHGLTSRIRVQAAELRQLATTDPLTGAVNRRQFEDALTRALAQAASENTGVSLAVLDLDHFKRFNDRNGHLAGDQLLQEMTAAWRTQLRPTDVLARFGGEEFVVLLPGATADEAEQIVERLLALVPGSQTCSAGVAHHAPAQGTRNLLARADQALYVAKCSGRARVAVARPTVGAVPTAPPGTPVGMPCDGASLRDELELAFASGQFRLFYQPLVAVRSGRVVGAEALLRWQHPTRGLLTPAAFLHEAEEMGLLVQLGTWVVEEAIRERANWPAGSYVSINLSPRELEHTVRSRLTDHIGDACTAAGVDPHDIMIEVTEQAITDLDNTLSAMQSLRALGVRLALDDFGTGYASLARLRDLPFDVCKLDRSFATKMNEPGGLTVIRAVQTMAQAYGMTVIAEGIETAGQLRQLADLDWELVQGFHLHRPMPAEQIRPLFCEAPSDVPDPSDVAAPRHLHELPRPWRSDASGLVIGWRAGAAV
ncbi:putative bifunctional diguanylate cyclase/phosphodiesterase [Egicoccus sp. AB-alg6-2]|uniref:putative bifunctional diguanylate cyclase/phosphodiesterase n=1 Tax=Egicoccus sp. AB-alg6-2 TaxID=3242692 RepID=UPI00359EA41B